MFEEFLPILYLGVAGAISVAGAKVYFNHLRENKKAAQKAIAQANGPDAGIDDFCNMLLNAPKLYEEYSKKISEIKARNPNADLGQENMELKILEYAAKHPTLIRMIVPVAKPIIARKLRGLSKSL